MLRNITGLFCIFILMVQIFAPALVILFFAVSPIQAFFGDHLKPDQETTHQSFICDMGIEWKEGSQQYISAAFGGSHDHHDHSQMQSMPSDHTSHAHHNHMDHSKMDHSKHMNHEQMADNHQSSGTEHEPLSY